MVKSAGFRKVRKLERQLARYFHLASYGSDVLFGPAVLRSARRMVTEVGVPVHFLQLLFAVEDKRFAYHCGIDGIAIVRAVLFNVVARPHRPHGASTIVQQIYSNRERRAGRYSPTMRFKVNQASWAVRETIRRSKSSLLTEYLDSVYFGCTYYGLSEASRRYCDCAPGDLTIAQSLFLVDRIGRPNRAFPLRIASLVSREPIGRLFAAAAGERQELTELYDRHFRCGEEVARCLESSLTK